ncbi:hypothetical protein F4781DRAFT_407656 [Annulohypoxylon bovei var. microspora]|nr:hypothetical protein F4781DRAFT_407656 [Annulohypoxylon bovei var. microspora]
MEYEPLAPKPLPVFGQGFLYNGRLTVKGIPRAEPEEVKRLISEPQGANPTDYHEWRAESMKTVTKSWLEAQVRHYGMELGPTDSYSKIELQERLRKESLKPDFSDIRRQYNVFGPGKFEEVKERWESQCAAYKESCFSGRRQENFDNLATLEEKLNFDIDMFIETYGSDKELLPTPIPFRGISFDFVMETLANVPNLYIQKVGTDFQKMLWVGWDRKAVKEACKEYAKVAKENAAARRLQKERNKVLAHGKKLEKMKAWRLVPHRDYLAKKDRNRGIEGSYIVEATFYLNLIREPDSQWMDIRSTDLAGVYEATFNFMPAVEGVMIFSQSNEDIQQYINGFEPPKNAPITTATSKNYATNTTGPPPGTKRKWGQTDNIEQTVWYERSHTKRMRPEMPAGDLPGGYTRYYTRWRGTMGTRTTTNGTYRVCENGEGNEWIDFLDGDKAQFIVHCTVPLLNGVAHCYKVSDQAKFEAIQWSTRPKVPTPYVWF